MMCPIPRPASNSYLTFMPLPFPELTASFVSFPTPHRFLIMDSRTLQVHPSSFSIKWIMCYAWKLQVLHTNYRRKPFISQLAFSMKVQPFDEFIEAGTEDGSLREECQVIVFDVLLSFLIFVQTSIFKFKDTELGRVQYSL